MHRLTLAMCWLILGTWLVPAVAQPTEDAEKKLQGACTGNAGGTRRQSSR
jgi:hypothetical protein